VEHDVVRGAVIHAPAAAVWDLVSDTDQFHRTATADHLWTFVAPGSPVGQVGERRVSLSRAPDGQVTAALVERTELIPGRRLVTKALTTSLTTTTTVEPRGDGACELTFRGRTVAPSVGPDAHLTAVVGAFDRRLARVSAVATGQALPVAPAPHAPPDTSDWTAHRITERGVVMAPPSRVWPVVRLTGGRLRPDERGAMVVATVPGTPQGRVGELLCTIGVDPPTVDVQEVVLDEVDRTFGVRYVSAATPVTRTVTLVPRTRGTEVSIEIEFRLPPSASPRTQAKHFRRAARTFLQCYQQAAPASGWPDPHSGRDR
jgi:hypothetical protein